MFDKFFDPHINFIKCLLLIACAMLAAAKFIAAKQAASDRAKRRINGGFLVIALLSVFAHLNMGFQHYQGGSFHGHDMFRHYMTAKYFKEVGYGHLYEAAIVADSEHKNFFRGVTTIRNLETLEIEPKQRAFEDQSAWRFRFSDSRWESFKQDLAFFQEKPGQTAAFGKPINLQWWNWQGILNDSAYMPSPVWHGAFYIITNIIPITSSFGLLLLTYSDLFLIALMGYALYRTFGLAVAAIFITYLCCSYTNFYSWAGASLFRLDWLALLTFSLCSMRNGRMRTSGMWCALASAIRIFPAIYALGVVPKSAMQWWQTKKIDAETKQFFASFVLTFAAVVISSRVLLPQGLETWVDYFERLALLSKQWDLWQWGMKDLFVWEGEVREAIAGNWMEVKGNRLASFAMLIVLMQLAAVIGLFFAARSLSYAETFALSGSVLLFVFCYISKIYYIHFALLSVMLAMRSYDGKRLIALSALIATNWMMYMWLTFQQTTFLLKFFHALGLSLTIAYLLYAVSKANTEKN